MEDGVALFFGGGGKNRGNPFDLFIIQNLKMPLFKGFIFNLRIKQTKKSTTNCTI